MLEIIIEPNNMLHTKVSRVTDITDKTDQIVQEMARAMKQANGIGLAAPQVNLNLQIAIVDVPKHKDDAGSNLITLINPKITWVSDDQTLTEEGCLSIPGIEVDVSRPDKITICFQGLDNKKQTLSADGLLARAIQHEIDHLNGILITDHGPARPIKSND